jgi:hypothetical protein
MLTIGYEGTDPDNLDLLQQCQTCGLTRKNRTAPDDNRDRLFRSLQNPTPSVQ